MWCVHAVRQGLGFVVLSQHVHSNASFSLRAFNLLVGVLPQHMAEYYNLGRSAPPHPNGPTIIKQALVQESREHLGTKCEMCAGGP